MSMMKRERLKYEDGRTKQAFKEETDVNKILAKAQRVGSLSHLVRHGATFGDFSDVPDLLEARTRLKRGQRIFDELPAEVRREFSNDMLQFFAFVNDPRNKERLSELLPAMAAPGRQLPEPKRSEAAAEAAEAIVTAVKERLEKPGDDPAADADASSTT